ncbi:hypothetical protein DRF75_02915 [Ehrlichia minasensis]|uniref:Uncharacterized protein n=1 Tax=Ehrlichia minasensis TaxID=1242993 RepID=A0A4Q6I7T4_9RICK|nr:hypothetical protein [Ehrlichia minasensis]RZB12669.1 hypothetical protein DRF75_02915 [Ehrlichia minasensis]
MGSPTSIKNFQPLERTAAIFAVLSLATFLFCAVACMDRFHELQLTDPRVIAGLVSLAVLLIACLTIAASMCLSKRQEIKKNSIKHHFGYESSTFSFSVLVVAGVSLLLFGAFLGKVMGTDPSKFFNNILDFSNPFAIAAAATLGIFVLSFLTYAVKNIIIPDKQNHVIILSNQQTLEEAKGDKEIVPNIFSAVLSAADVDVASLASCEIIAVSQQSSQGCHQ